MVGFVGRWWPFALSLAATTALLSVPWRRRRRDRAAQLREEARPRWLWLLTDHGIGATVAVVAGLGVAAMVVLLQVASEAAVQPLELAKLRIEAISTGWGR